LVGAVVTGCGGDDSDSAGQELSEPPTGTFEMTVVADAPRPGCVNGEIHIELVVDTGSLSRRRIIGGERGAAQQFDVSIFRDRITIRDSSRELTARWTFDGTDLVFSQLDGGRCEDLSDWSAGPFTLVVPSLDPSSITTPGSTLAGG
jgi:hypothetical protein